MIFSSLVPSLFFARGGEYRLEGEKNCLVNSLFTCGLKLGDTTSCIMWRHTSMKLWNTSKETARCRDHPSRSSRIPRNKTWSLFRPQKALRRSYRHLKLRNFTLPVGNLRNTYHAFMEVLVFLRWSVLRLSILYNASTAKPSLVAIYCSTWRRFHEAIWLERHQRGAWNKPDYFSQKNRLGRKNGKLGGAWDEDITPELGHVAVMSKILVPNGVRYICSTSYIPSVLLLTLDTSVLFWSSCTVFRHLAFIHPST